MSGAWLSETIQSASRLVSGGDVRVNSNRPMMLLACEASYSGIFPSWQSHQYHVLSQCSHSPTNPLPIRHLPLSFLPYLQTAKPEPILLARRILPANATNAFAGQLLLRGEVVVVEVDAQGGIFISLAKVLRLFRSLILI